MKMQAARFAAEATILSVLATACSAIDITGARQGAIPTGPLPFRYEINSFAQSGPAYDLYVLSLLNLQSANQTDPLSYFQIAGIHGFPKIPWDGVVGAGDGIYPGYCMHYSVNFPTWHRPYLALYEQAIWTQAQVVASTYPPVQRKTYQAAALTLRLPYWDWAYNPVLPGAVTSERVVVNSPVGRLEVPNPLYQYTFHPGTEGNGIPFGYPISNATKTMRHANIETQQSNQTAASNSMLANSPNIVALVYQLLTSITEYTMFSSVPFKDHAVDANSIENVHNLVHNLVGGFTGHMYFPELSAFDPIFWLHHANVDRLFAIWQVLNPESYVTPTVNDFGSYFESPGTVDAANTSLAPFHTENGTTMLTSSDVRHTRFFHYTYPELVDWDTTPSALTASLKSTVNRLYSPDRATLKRSHEERATSVEQAFSHVTLQTAQALGVNDLSIQWSIQILLDLSVCGGTISVDFFIGSPPADGQSTAPNLVGTYSQFGNMSSTSKQGNDVHSKEMRGVVSLTHVLAAGVARGYLADLSPQSVVPTLSQHLTWTVRTNGQKIETKLINGLSVSVQSRNVQPRTSEDTFPSYGEYRQYPEATARQSSIE